MHSESTVVVQLRPRSAGKDGVVEKRSNFDAVGHCFINNLTN